MGYAMHIRNIFNDIVPRANIDVKWLSDGRYRFPVIFSLERASRPFKVFEPTASEDCILCARIRKGRTSAEITPGMEWLPASFPIKAYHGICYPADHRAAMLVDDFIQFGMFADRMGDAVICINLRGSGASIPEHFHGQIHLDQLTAVDGASDSQPAFPMLHCAMETLADDGLLRLDRIVNFPVFALCLHGPWELLGCWVIGYLASSTTRPVNLAIAPTGRLFIIPRTLEKAPTQENRYGCSEMLGLISPVTRTAYDALDSIEVILQALSSCGVQHPKEQQAIVEHALWITRSLPSLRGVNCHAHA